MLTILERENMYLEREREKQEKRDGQKKSNIIWNAHGVSEKGQKDLDEEHGNNNGVWLELCL